MWKYTGNEHPPFAETPRAGQESVWDYPRPPRLVADERTVEVRAGTTLLARSARSLRVLETASPPTFYVPPEDVATALLVRVDASSWCEWKGRAVYDALAKAPEKGPVAWRYPEPHGDYAALAGYVGFFPGRVRCTVDGERVRPQPGGFYGGWITDEIVGPFKGEPGTEDW